MIKISLIIPVYNVEKYLEKCLNSCVNQDISDEEYEIIIINDGTRDGSLIIALDFEQKYKNIKVYSQENQGLSAARNKGLSLAKGEYVWFIDSDDWIEENCLKSITDKCFKENLDALAIAAANVIDGKNERRFNFNTSGVYRGKDVLREGIMSVCAPFTIYNRNFLLKNNLFFKEGIFHEDSEFTPRAYYFLNRISFLNDIYYFVRQNPSSITRTPNPKKAFDCITVAKSLSCFAENVDIDLKTKYDNLISMNINNSLFNTFEMSEEKINELNLFIYKNRFLFKHLLASSILKYKLEGVLFYIWQKKTVQVYQNLQKLNVKSVLKK